jgi:Zn-finger nucleic acid-binding protein
MIVACTACNNRFEAAGYRDTHCPNCGAFAQQANVRACPRCELPLTARQVSDVVIDECSGCEGLFLDDTAIRRVLDAEDSARAEALLAALPRRPTSHTAKGGKMYIKCPTCSTLMNRKLFATGSGIVIDVCKAHGTFFDGGELPTIIEFVQRGGLAVAAKKDALRDQQDERERRAANDRSRARHNRNYISDDAAALGVFLSSIFD